MRDGRRGRLVADPFSATDRRGAGLFDGVAGETTGGVPAGLAAGVYVVRVQRGGHTATARLVVAQ